MLVTEGRVKKAVESYYELLARQEKLQKRMIRVSGKDPEQEAILAQNLEAIEYLISVIDHEIYEEDNLSGREAAAVHLRIEGRTLKEIGDVFGVTGDRARQMLLNAYKKLVQVANQRMR